MVAESDRPHTYEEAKAIVTEGLALSWEETGKIKWEGFENRWVDVYENEGKVAAHTPGAFGSHPMC